MTPFPSIERSAEARFMKGNRKAEDLSEPDFEQFLQRAKKQFREAEQGSSEMRAAGLDNLKFFLGAAGGYSQWAPQILNDRAAMNRPCEEFNLLTSFVAQVTNEQRQSRPALQINPMGSGAEIGTAEVIQGLTRHIEQRSDAETAYDTAFEHAAIMGFGYWRLRSDYASDDSTDQEIIVDPIDDPFRVYLDPTAKLRDRSDARYAFLASDLTRDQFEFEYPNSEFQSLESFRTLGDLDSAWYSGGTCRVVEYYWVEEKPQLLVRLTTGRSVPSDQLGDQDMLELRNGMPITRKSMRRVIKWCQMSAAEVLEPEKTIPGNVIPIIPVYGRQMTVEGKKKYIGMVSPLQGAQRAYNFDRNALIEVNALVPKAPWLATAEQIEGYEEMYRQSNIRNLAYILYHNVKDVSGQPLPPPQRLTAAPATQHLLGAIALDSQDMKAISGIWNAGLGEPSNEQSGRAIDARTAKGDVSNFNFSDNLKRAIKASGLIIIKWIPKIYDVARTVRIVKPDKTHELVVLNHPFVRNGKIELYDVTVGDYDVTVSVGPSYASKRQEFVESVLALAKAAPQLIGFIADLLVRNMDWPGAQEIADRLKKMLPPQLQEGEDGQQPPIPPQFQAQMQQLSQQLAMITQAYQEAQQTIQTRRVETESKEKIAALQARTMLVIQEMKDRAADGRALTEHDYSAIEHQLNLLDQQAGRAQEQEQAEADRDAAAKQQQAQQAQAQKQIAGPKAA